MILKNRNSIALFVAAILLGCTTKPKNVENMSSTPSMALEQPMVRPLQIPPRISRWLAKTNIDFCQTEDGSGVYRLTLSSSDLISADQREYIQEYFRARVAESFAKSNAIKPCQVAVAIVLERMENTTYLGEATACGVDDISLAYDSDTHMGMLSMKIRNGDFDGTRKIIRQHIEGIVRDKNIRLVTGIQPPPGRYYLLDETVKTGNVLEVKFKSE